MSGIQLVPGYGGKYTSESIAGVASPGTVGADVIDTSECSQFAVQVTDVTNAASSTLQVEHTMDGVNWASLGTTLAIAIGAITRFGAFSGPYGKIRLKVIDAAGAVHVTFTVVGWSMQVRN